MDPTPEGSPITELNPVQKQTQLKSIYAALPETGSLAEKNGPGHFTFNIPSEGVTPEEKSMRFPESVGKFMQDSVTRKELPNLKFEQLKELLKDAKIMPLLKEKIEYVFNGAFAFGISREFEEKDPDSIFEIIGATAHSDVLEGMFSLDPKVRSSIDKKYLDKLTNLIPLYNDYIRQSKEQNKPERISQFELTIKSLEEQIQRGRTEYNQLYPTIT